MTYVHADKEQPDPEPVDPSTIYVPWKGEWDKDTTFAVGDYTVRDGVIYRAKVPHGAAYQGTWGPPAAGVWDVISQ